ncbi:MAG: hypothetical protein V5A68_06065, partial [Candidatus Thermoplasmatota archaeon]
DNGYILTGYTWSRNDAAPQIWLIKTNQNGNEEWNKTYGGKKLDIGYSVKQTSDGGYLIAGKTESEGAGKEDIILVKTDEEGIMEWTQTYGSSETEIGRSAIQSSDGHYYIIGQTNSYGSGWFDLWMIKTDDKGKKIWSKTIGGTGNDMGRSIQETQDGGLICTGNTDSFSAKNQDVWLVKTDKNGNEEWNKTFGKDNDDRGYDVQQTTDQGYIIVGSQHLMDEDLWLIKTDRNGNEKWNKTFGIRETDIGRSVKQISDGGYIITGWTKSYGKGEADVWLIKIPSQNHPPNKPSTISGITSGKTGKDYTFSTTTSDIDDDQIWYQWYWDDGTTSKWIGPYQSDETCEVKHNWTQEKTYQIKVRSKDELNSISPWSETSTVDISYEQAWLIGSITNKKQEDGSISFDAETVIHMSSDPFELKTTRDIHYVVTENYNGVLLDSVILGKFNIQKTV